MAGWRKKVTTRKSLLHLSAAVVCMTLQSLVSISRPEQARKNPTVAAADRRVQSRQTNDSWQRLAVECTLEGEELMFVFITARNRLPPSDPVTFLNDATRRGWKQFSGESLQPAASATAYSLLSPVHTHSALKAALSRALLKSLRSFNIIIIYTPVIKTIRPPKQSSPLSPLPSALPN